MVVFDSTVAPETGQAVYMTATAEQVTDADEARRCLGVSSRSSVHRSGRSFSIDSITGTSRNRLYCATVAEHFILDPDSAFDVRVRVEPRVIDHQEDEQWTTPG